MYIYFVSEISLLQALRAAGFVHSKILGWSLVVFGMTWVATITWSAADGQVGLMLWYAGPA